MQENSLQQQKQHDDKTCSMSFCAKPNLLWERLTACKVKHKKNPLRDLLADTQYLYLTFEMHIGLKKES